MITLRPSVTRSRIPTRMLGVLAIAVVAPLSLSAQTTGFNQTAAGPFDYNLSTNWVGSTINGVWSSDLTLAAAQTVTFGTNTTASTGLDFRYAGAQNLTLRADGTGPYALTLGGNINVDTASANRTITIGSTTANQVLNVDLGNAIRTFSVGGIAASNSTRTLTLNNSVTNGGLILNGGGIVNLNGNANTLSSLRVQNSALRLTGNGGSDVSTTVSGALTIDGAASSVASNIDHLGGIATITLTPNAGHNTALSAASLDRANKGVVFFRGNNLGGTLGANGVSNITFTSSPTLVGGGGLAGTKNISVLSWAVGATTAAGNANTFVTYDSVNGIRPLDTATEFETYLNGHNGAVVGTDNNSRIAAGATVNFTGNNTVNSLFVGDATAGILTGDGTLTVTSGAVFLQNASSIALNLNFGAREGVIGYSQGQNSVVSGSIAGSGGLTVYQAQSNTSTFSNGNGVTFSGDATFTGDFNVNSRATVTSSNFLAHGARTGNTVVNGLLVLSGSGTGGAGFTMNGLNGNGRIDKTVSNAATIRIGDNNSNGNFTGRITQFGATSVQKIGTGTQIFGGASTYSGGTQVLAGTLLITNTTGSGTGTGGVSVASGASFGGTGISTGLVTASAADSTIIAGGVGSIGTLNLAGGFAAASGATFTFEVNGASVDMINFGAASVSMGGVATFNFTSLGEVQTGSAYSLFAGSGDWSSVSSTFTITAPTGYILDTSFGTGGYLFDAGSHTMQVQFASAIPEPSAFALFGGVAALAIAGTRRRKLRTAGVAV